jgi:hypothetical protein
VTHTVKSVTPKKKVKKKPILIPGISRGRIHSMGFYEPKKDSLCDKPHPLQVKVGKYEIFTIGKFDYDEDEHYNIMKDLDVFFGLDSSWSRLEVLRTEYENPLIQSIYNKLYGTQKVLNNMIATHIPDRGIDVDIYKIIRKTLLSGKKIGFGCQAGHGRTGWVLAKLIKSIEKCNGDEAVKRTRERYCMKCVESDKQIEDLGCKVIKKTDKPYSGKVGVFGGADSPYSFGGFGHSFDDDYYKPMSSRKDWFASEVKKDPCMECDKPYGSCEKCEHWTDSKGKELAVVVEDEENRDLVESVAKENLASIGYIDPVTVEDDDDEEVKYLTKVYEKWMRGEKLTDGVQKAL